MRATETGASASAGHTHDAVVKTTHTQRCSARASHHIALARSSHGGFRRPERRRRPSQRRAANRRGRLRCSRPRPLASARPLRGVRHALAAINNYAALMQVRGRLEEAEALYGEAVATSRFVQPGHPDTMTAIWNLADLLHKMGCLEEAEGLMREALAGRQATLGVEHSRTRNVASGLERLLRDKVVVAHAASRR